MSSCPVMIAHPLESSGDRHWLFGHSAEREPERGVAELRRPFILDRHPVDHHMHVRLRRVPMRDHHRRGQGPRDTTNGNNVAINPKLLSDWGQSPAPAVRATAGAGSAASARASEAYLPSPRPAYAPHSLFSVDLQHLLQQLLIREAPEFPVIDRGIVADVAAPPARPRRHLGPFLRPFHASSVALDGSLRGSSAESLCFSRGDARLR